METYYTIGIILLLAFAVTWHYIRLQKISRRHIESDYALRQIHSSLNWKQFIVPSIFFGLGLYGKVNAFIISLGATLFVSIIVEWVLTQKYDYDVFAICGDILVCNDFKIKNFNLQELAIIDFLPFSDSLQLKFQGGQSVSIHRANFDKDSLSIFFQKAIGKK